MVEFQIVRFLSQSIIGLKDCPHNFQDSNSNSFHAKNTKMLCPKFSLAVLDSGCTKTVYG